MRMAKGAGNSDEYDDAMCRRRTRAYSRCLPTRDAVDYLEWVDDGTALSSSARTGENSS